MIFCKLVSKEIYGFSDTFQITIENEYCGTLQKDEIEKNNSQNHLRTSYIHYVSFIV